jgi:cobalt-precorrin 5A hydrolase
VTTPTPASTAIWAISPNGVRLARQLADGIPGSQVFLSARLASGADGTARFDRLTNEVHRQFGRFSRHVFIMATGIVVRTIATRLVHKVKDPAVVVCDEIGRFAISLVSGHVGGANALAYDVAGITGGQAVITTATDVNRLPSIDLIALRQKLGIDTPGAIKTVNMALLTGEPIRLHDPYGRVTPLLPAGQVEATDEARIGDGTAGIYVGHKRLDLPPHVLVLRPGSLVAGMGCNRGADVDEMRDLLIDTLARNGLAAASLRCIATVDLKADEPGLVALAESLGIPLTVYSRDRLNRVTRVPTPSTMVEKHIGVKSVCEAAAILAARRGQLIVPKHKTANVTVAIAADGFTSSASDPAAPIT